jgi:hypothetical protein
MLSRKSTILVIVSVVIAVFWYISLWVVGLMVDNDQPHPLLEIVQEILIFPLGYTPVLGSYDSRTAVMPFQTWEWISGIVIILNGLLW